MSSPYRVAIVVDRAFGPRLAPLAERLHVWICDSPDNRAAAEDVWKLHRDRAYDIESGATVFDCPHDKPLDDALIDVLGTVDTHHGEYSHDPPWSVIEVFGRPPTSRIREAFSEFGAQIENQRDDGFEACRNGKEGA